MDRFDPMAARVLPARRWLTPLLLIVGTAAVVAPAAAFAVHTFADVSDDSVHAEAIAWLADSMVTAGCDEANFCGSESVTREQMASFLHRLSGNDPKVPAVVNAATVGGLTAADLQGQQGPAGPQGFQGEIGPVGQTGLQGLTGAQGNTGPKGDTGRTGPMGPQGIQGPAGTNGTDGVAGYHWSEARWSMAFQNLTQQNAWAWCPEGKVVLGGGARFESSDHGAINYVNPFQAVDGIDPGVRGVPAGYVVNYTPSAAGVAAEAGVFVYAICADVD